MQDPCARLVDRKIFRTRLISHFKGSSRNKHEKGLYVEHPVTYERKNSVLVK